MMAVSSANEIFQRQIPNRLQAKPGLVEKIHSVFRFVVTGDSAGTWLVDLTKPGGSVEQKDGPADCTITVAGKDLVDIVNGKLDPQMAFMGGKIRIAGDMGLALKLGLLIG